MEIISNIAWVYYRSNTEQHDSNKCGKWMYFFDNKEFVANICENAVKNNIVSTSKHSNNETGVACFYLNHDDIETHKRVISYFIENNLIRRTKDGRLHNISFKLDSQTKNGEYGDKFNSEIKLSNFIDLYTGEWLL